MSKSSKSSKATGQPGDPGCVFHGLREASKKEVMRQYADHVADSGGLPRKAGRENRVVCRNLTYDEAVGYLSMVQRKLLAVRGVMAALIVPWVVAWWTDGDDGDALGFPVEVWMTQAADDKAAAKGLYDIVDRSAHLYKLPWMFGMGWVQD